MGEVSNPGVTAAQIPQPAQSAPPSVAEASAQGNIARYAMENHTHASKNRRGRLQTAANGSLTWQYRDKDGNPAPFAPGMVPIIIAMAQSPSGVTDVYNVQTVGDPTNTSCLLQVNRVQQSVVALLGLTILSVPAAPGATWVNLVALEP